MYPAQLERFLAVLRGRQSQAEGGWGARLDLDNTSLSIVTSVQALRALRAVRTPYDDEVVQAGLAYVADKVRKHPFPSAADQPEARGANPRYCAFGLLGLTTWDEGRHDAALADAQTFCVQWLQREALEHGGWPDSPEEDALSLTATSPAIRGLDRVCPHLADADVARGLARRARDEIARQAQGRGPHRWWAQHPDWRDSSVAATSLAVLALVSGGPEHRRLAEAGARWLMQHVSEWTTHNLTEVEWRILNRQWTHMNFSLALRAVVGPAGRVDPSDPRLKPAIEHLDHLWSEEHGAWGNGYPGRPPTTSGSGAVISATETLRRHWRFDPLADLRRRRVRPAPAPPATGSVLRLALRRNHALLVEDDGSVFATVNLTRSPRQRELLEILVERHHTGAAAHELRARTVSAKQLAVRLKIKVDSVRRTVDRLNDRVRDAQGLTVLVQALVEDREVDGEPGITRWGLTLEVAPDDPADASAVAVGA